MDNNYSASISHENLDSGKSVNQISSEVKNKLKNSLRVTPILLLLDVK